MVRLTIDTWSEAFRDAVVEPLLIVEPSMVHLLVLLGCSHIQSSLLHLASRLNFEELDSLLGLLTSLSTEPELPLVVHGVLLIGAVVA